MGALRGEAALSIEVSAVLAVIRAHQGREAAITGEAIAELTGIRYMRVREVVRELVDKGILIGSTTKPPSGYYLIRTPEEVAEVTKSLRRRGISILVRAARIQQCSLETVYGQARMELSDGTPI